MLNEDALYTIAPYEVPFWASYTANKSTMGTYMDMAAVWTEGTSRLLVAGSFIGPDTAVKGIMAAAVTGKTINLYDAEPDDYPSTQPSQILYGACNHLQSIKIQDGVTHGIVSGHLNPKDTRGESSRIILLAPDGDIAQPLWNLLWTSTSIPMTPEWIPHLPGVLAAKNVLRYATVYLAKTFPDPDFRVAVLNLNQIKIAEAISWGVQSGRLKIPAPSIPLESDEIPPTLDEYLTVHGKAILEHFQAAFPARHTPDDPDHPRIAKLLRKPYAAQSLVIQGLAKALKEEIAVKANGEMGTGKTYITAAVPYLAYEGAFRTLVLCPPHLVHKWAREVKETVPDAKAVILDSMKDLVALKDQVHTKPNQPTYYIMARTKMARSATLAFAGQAKTITTYNDRGEAKQQTVYHCPDCGKRLMHQVDEDTVKPWTPAFVAHLKKGNEKCLECKTPLWAPKNNYIAHRAAFFQGIPAKNPGGKRYFMPYQFVKRHLHGFFDLLIADEAHELKGDTNRGSAFGTLVSACAKTIEATGTVIGGYASHLYYSLYRTNPKKVKELGIKYGDVAAWVEQYGTLEEVYRSNSDRGQTGKGKTANRGEVRERPGISPSLFADFLLPIMATISLEDLGADLPPFDEDVIPVAMLENLKAAYSKAETVLTDHIRENRYSSGDPGFRYQPALNQIRLRYADQPFNWNPVCSKVDENWIICQPADLGSDQIYPKEAALVEEVRSQLAQDRRLLIYIEDSGKRDIAPRLSGIISQKIPSAKIAILTTSITPDKREDWFKRQVEQKGVNVVIVNPGLVETGLDLLWFPSIVFYQDTFNLFRMRQSGRRSWRIGQKNPVRVRHIYYAETGQEDAIYHMGKKLYAAMAIDGKFGGNALLELVEDEIQDGTRIAAKLAESVSGDAVWAKIRAKQAVLAAEEQPALPASEPATQAETPKQRTLEDFQRPSNIILLGLIQPKEPKKRRKVVTSVHTLALF